MTDNKPFCHPCNTHHWWPIHDSNADLSAYETWDDHPITLKLLDKDAKVYRERARELLLDSAGVPSTEKLADAISCLNLAKAVETFANDLRGDLLAEHALPRRIGWEAARQEILQLLLLAFNTAKNSQALDFDADLVSVGLKLITLVQEKRIPQVVKVHNWKDFADTAPATPAPYPQTEDEVPFYQKRLQDRAKRVTIHGPWGWSETGSISVDNKIVAGYLHSTFETEEIQNNLHPNYSSPICDRSHTIVAAVNRRFKSVEELIAFCKANPDLLLQEHVTYQKES